MIHIYEISRDAKYCTKGAVALCGHVALKPTKVKLKPRLVCGKCTRVSLQQVRDLRFELQHMIHVA